MTADYAPCIQHASYINYQKFQQNQLDGIALFRTAPPDCASAAPYHNRILRIQPHTNTVKYGGISMCYSGFSGDSKPPGAKSPYGN